MTTQTIERTSARTPYYVAGGVALATLALRLHDPHVQGSWGFCPFRAFTGFDCPGCGGLRAVNDLTHGDVGAAVHSNLFFVVSIPVVLALWFWWARGASPLPRGVKVLLVVWAAAGVAFTVWRNTPWGGAFWV